MLSGINPHVWMAVGLLMPSVLICLSVVQQYRYAGSLVESAVRLGPYVLKSKLGAGGMGEVFLAEHQLMKRQCAVKLIHPQQARDRHMRESFEREAQATAQLTHWNTVEVYDYGTTEDGRFYYVMEYLKGMNLSQYVERFGPMRKLERRVQRRNSGCVIFRVIPIADCFREKWSSFRNTAYRKVKRFITAPKGFFIA
ncbi:MAG: protein kinase [Fuerstiella sp.]|nr:protein kinase [Fuerstiella sp.]